MSETIQKDDEFVAEISGREVDNVITMHDFVDERDKLRFAADNAPGTKAWLGTIIGRVNGGEEKINTRTDGSKLRSFMFAGYFESQRYSDGVIKNAPNLFLPKSIASELEMTLEQLRRSDPDGRHIIEVELEMGMEVTGKSIPIGYRVRAFHQRTADPLADLRANRARRLSAVPPAQRPAALAADVVGPKANPEPAMTRHAKSAKEA
jgi:hypothetical protein